MLIGYVTSVAHYTCFPKLLTFTLAPRGIVGTVMSVVYELLGRRVRNWLERFIRMRYALHANSSN